MRKQTLIGIILFGLILGVVLLVAVLWPKQELQRTSLVEHRLETFSDVGMQMEIPSETPFVSSSPGGVLIMIHKLNQGLRGEAGYLIKLEMRRISKASMDNRLEFASQPTSDEIQQWRYKMHSRLDVRKESTLWYVRKDIETPGGEFLSVDAELMVTEFAETDLSESRRIIESIKLIPKSSEAERPTNTP